MRPTYIPRKSREHWKSQKSTMLNECNWRFTGLYRKRYETEKFILYYLPFLTIESIFLHQSQ